MLTLKRFNDHFDNATIGALYLDGEYICDTLEPKEGYFNSKSDRQRIQLAKDLGRICIPTGCYPITLEVESPRYSKRKVYEGIHYRLPRLINVPCFNGILIHIGNTPKDTRGCILVGEWVDRNKAELVNSTQTFFDLYKLLLKVKPTHINIITDYDFAT